MSAFWDRGFAATSLTDLSEAMGMNRPSMYAAFGDKRAIFLKALARYEAHMGESFAAPLMAEPDLRRALTNFYFGVIDVYLSGESGQRGCMVVSMASVESSHDEEVREAVRKTISRLDGLFTERIRRAEEQGELPRGQASQRGPLAAAVVHSLSVRARAGHSRRALRKFARESVAMLVGT